MHIKLLTVYNIFEEFRKRCILNNIPSLLSARLSYLDESVECIG